MSQVSHVPPFLFLKDGWTLAACFCGKTNGAPEVLSGPDMGCCPECALTESLATWNYVFADEVVFRHGIDRPFFRFDRVRDWSPCVAFRFRLGPVSERVGGTAPAGESCSGPEDHDCKREPTLSILT